MNDAADADSRTGPGLPQGSPREQSSRVSQYPQIVGPCRHDTSAESR